VDANVFLHIDRVIKISFSVNSISFSSIT
jgi:hypothetical protein